MKGERRRGVAQFVRLCSTCLGATRGACGRSRHDLRYRQLAMAWRSATSTPPDRLAPRVEYIHCKAVTGEGARRFAVAPTAAHDPAMQPKCCRCCCPVSIAARHRIPVRRTAAFQRTPSHYVAWLGRRAGSVNPHKREPDECGNPGHETRDLIRRTSCDTTLDVITYGEAMAMFVAAETGPLADVFQFTKRVAGADLNVAIQSFAPWLPR